MLTIRAPEIGPNPALYAGGAQLRRITAARIRDICEMPEQATVTELADRHRVLPDGKTYISSVVPYARRFQDLMTDPSIPMLVACWGVQLTKSTSIENALLYRIYRMPSRMLVVHPKTDYAEMWAKETFRPMIRSTAVLRKRVRIDRGSEATLRYYKFPGGSLFIASAQSASEIAGRSSDFLFLDEVDRMEVIPGEGNPVEIAFRRQAGADIGMAVLTSTPRDAESTIIWPYLEDGSFELFCVPCPHCGFVQPLLFRHLRWDWENRETAHYVCAGRPAMKTYVEELDKLANERAAAANAGRGKDGADAESKPKAADLSDPIAGEQSADTWRVPLLDRARLLDGGCGGTIDESFKPRMLEAGQWFATNLEGNYPSSHLNSLYSPFAKSRWAVLAEEWQRSNGKPKDMQVFINTRLAELWEEKADVDDPNALKHRREFDLKHAIVPRGVGALTIGWDVQHNRVEGYVWGWGAGLESWPIAYVLIPGDPQLGETHPHSLWGQVDEFNRQLYAHVDSNGIAFIPASVVFIDSGFASTQVYRFTNKRKGQNVFACKGDTGPIPLVGKPSLVGREKAVLYTVNVDEAKNEFIRSHLLERRVGPAFVHIPGWFTDTQCEQLMSEKRKRRLDRGRVVYVWIKRHVDAPNEGLDCRNYARGALEAAGTAFVDSLGQLAESVTKRAQELAAAGVQPTSAGSGGPARRILSKGLG